MAAVNCLSTTQFRYELPGELIARHAATPRSASRLLLRLPHAPHGPLAPHVAAAAAAHAPAVATSRGARLHDLRFEKLPSLLPKGTHLVFNESRVFEARLLARGPSAYI